MAVKVRRPQPRRQEKWGRMKARTNGGSFLEEDLQTLKKNYISSNIRAGMRATDLKLSKDLCFHDLSCT